MPRWLGAGRATLVSSSSADVRHALDSAGSSSIEGSQPGRASCSLCLANQHAMDRSLLLLGAFLTISNVCAQVVPVYHWPLDESTGLMAHAWGGSDGTLLGGTQWDPNGGHHQGAARFDGVDDRIVLGACDITTGDGFSISLWTKADFVTGMDRTLVAKTIGPQLADHIWSVAFTNGSALRFRLKAGGSTTELATPPASLFGGMWYHIVVTYDGAEMRLLLNGALMAEVAKSGAIGYHPQAPASLGALSTGTQLYSGWIDDVRIFDRALTDAEVLDLLFGSMTTSIDDPGSSSDLSQLLQRAAPGDRFVVRDILGRLERTLAATTLSDLDLSSLPAGIHTVCLEGLAGRQGVRVLVP